MGDKYIALLSSKIKDCKDALAGRASGYARFDKRAMTQRLRRLEAELAVARKKQEDNNG